MRIAGYVAHDSLFYRTAYFWHSVDERPAQGERVYWVDIYALAAWSVIRMIGTSMAVVVAGLIGLGLVGWICEIFWWIGIKAFQYQGLNDWAMRSHALEPVATITAGAIGLIIVAMALIIALFIFVMTDWRNRRDLAESFRKYRAKHCANCVIT